MSGEITVIPGKTYDESQGEKNDLSKLNLTANPTARVNEQSICTRELGDGCITADKLAEDVLAQINADAFIADGAITTVKIANGAVTKVKLNQDVLDCFIRRDTILTTIGTFPRYSTTDGITEEVTATQIQSDLGISIKAIAFVLYTRANNAAPSVSASDNLTPTSKNANDVTCTFGTARANANYIVMHTNSMIEAGGAEGAWAVAANKTTTAFDIEGWDIGGPDFPASGTYTFEVIVFEV